MHGELGFDFKSVRLHREGLDQAPRQHAIAGEHVGWALAEEHAEQRIECAVAEAMAAAIRGSVFLVVADAGDEVEVVADERCHHLRRARCIVRRVAVGHHVDVGIDFREHPAHDAALAGTRFVADDCTGGPGNVAGAIGGAVVVDVDHAAGQRGAEIGNDARDRRGLVVTRHEHCNPGLRHHCIHSLRVRRAAYQLPVAWNNTR